MQVNPKGSEEKLIRRLADLKSVAANTWIALYFSFDKLLLKHQSNYSINIAVTIMDDLLGQREAEVYICKDSSVFLLCNKIPNSLLEKLIFQVKYFFIEDPIARGDTGPDGDLLCSRYALDMKLDELTSLALSKLIGKAPTTEESTPENEAAIVAATARDLFTANTNIMAQLEAQLNRDTIKTIIRKQAAYLVREGFPSRKVFGEVYVSIEKLEEWLQTSLTLHTNRWLFKYATEILDARMLDFIEHDQESLLNSSISLNLNISTLLSERFRVFDATLKKLFRFALIIEIQLSDVFNDMQAFIAARSLVHGMGHRICLDGLCDIGFTLIDYDNLGFDMVKLRWNEAMFANLQRSAEQHVTDKIKAFGTNRIILSRCDSQVAVDYGQTLGISIFQGRYLDWLNEPNSPVKN